MHNHTFGAVDVAAKGDQYIEMASDAPMYVAQQLPTVYGKKYHVSISYSGRPGLSADQNRINVMWGAKTTGAISVDASAATMNSWHTLEFDAVAPGPSTFFAIADDGTPDSVGMYIDEVHVVPVA